MASFRGPLFSQAPAWLPPWLISDMIANNTPSIFDRSCKDVEEFSFGLDMKSSSSPIFQDSSSRAHCLLRLSEEISTHPLACESLTAHNLQDEYALLPSTYSQPKALILQLSLSPKEMAAGSSCKYDWCMRNEVCENIIQDNVMTPQHMVGATGCDAKSDPLHEVSLEAGLHVAVTEAHIVNSTANAGKLISSPTSQCTRSTELYASPAQQIDLCDGEGIDQKLEVKTSGDKKAQPVLKRRVENHISANKCGKKAKLGNSKHNVEDVQAVIRLTVATAEALVIADVMKGCLACQDCGSEAILDAALKVKRGRELCGLDDFSIEFLESEDSSDGNWIEGLDDKSLDEECLVTELAPACIDAVINVQNCSEKDDKVSTLLGIGVTEGEHHLDTSSLQHQGHNQTNVCGEAGVREGTCVSPLTIHIPEECNSVSQAIFPCNHVHQQTAPKEAFNSRWLGGWTGMVNRLHAVIGKTDHGVEEIHQNMAAFGKKQTFVDFETSNLTEPCDAVPLEIIQKELSRPQTKGALSLRTSVLEQFKIEHAHEQALSAGSCAEILIAMSQASVKCSSWTLQEPLCSFVPCTIPANVTPSSTKLAESAGQLAQETGRSGDIVAANTHPQRNEVSETGICSKDPNVVKVKAVPESLLDLVCESKQVHATSHQGFDKIHMTEQKHGASQVLCKSGVKRRQLSSLKSYSTSPVPSLLKAATSNTAIGLCLQLLPKDIPVVTNEEHMPVFAEEGIETMKTKEVAKDKCSSFPISAQFDTIIQKYTSDIFVKANGSTDQRRRLFEESELQDSPPLTWHRGKKRRLRACRIIESSLIEDIHDDDVSVILPDHCPITISDKISSEVGNIVGKEEILVTKSGLKPDIFLQGNSDQTPTRDNCLSWKSRAAPSLKVQKESQKGLRVSKHGGSLNSNGHKSGARKLKGSSTADGKQDLFKGLEFLLTGFPKNMKSMCMQVTKKIEEHGGVLLSSVPIWSPLHCRQSQQRQQAVTRLPIIIAPQKVRTMKFLYGCAAGCLIVRPNWIDDCIAENTLLFVKKAAEKGKRYHKSYLHCERKTFLLFSGIEAFVQGQRDYCTRMSSLVQVGGGKLLQNLRHSGKQKSATRSLIQIVVVEHQSRMPRSLKDSAATLGLPIVSGDWIIASLLEGRILPLPAVASLNLYSDTNPKLAKGISSKDVLLTKRKHQEHSAGNEDIPFYSSVRSDSKRQNADGLCTTVLDEGTRRPRLLGLGLSFDFLMKKYTKAHASTKLGPMCLYYKAVRFNGVIYSAGDILEMHPYTEQEKECYVAQIDGFYSGQQSSFNTRSVGGNVGKVYFMCCRWFYRPSETGFSCLGTSKELYLSHHIDDMAPVQNIIRKVSVAFIVEGKIFANNHEMGWKAPTEGSSCTVDAADYSCKYFYDYEKESLHVLKSGFTTSSSSKSKQKIHVS